MSGQPDMRHAVMPFTAIFGCNGGAVRRERFDFDLAMLCRQIELPIAPAAQLASGWKVLQAEPATGSPSLAS